MNMKTPLKLLLVSLLTLLCGNLFAQTFVQGTVPDWNQPYAYLAAPAPGGPGADPNAANPPGA